MDDREDLIAEYDDRDEAEIRTDIYRELEWVRYERGRKQGWTGIKFKELFGCWPPEWMRSLTPAEPREAVMRLVKRWDARFKREARKREGESRSTLLEGAKEATKKGNGYRRDGEVEG